MARTRPQEVASHDESSNRHSATDAGTPGTGFAKPELPRYHEHMENEEGKRITIDRLAGMMANGFAEMRDQFAALESHVGDLDIRVAGAEAGLSTRIDNLAYKVDQLGDKLQEHRQETKDGFAGVHRLLGGISTTLADHEERIRGLEEE